MNFNDEIEQKKDDLFFQKLLEIGVRIDFEQEQAKRFKSFSREVKGDEETIYYNNGSIDGLRIITFVTKVDFQGDKVGFTTEFY